MQYVEFGGGEEDEDSAENGYTVEGNTLGLALPSPNPRKTSENRQNTSLESLLATKNKRITEELTRLRVNHPIYELRHSSMIDMSSRLPSMTMK